ncbi:unnamed protein product [Mesocestoides corti]|uniref:RRM domain-containing protein n=1 Tax=Mesocestoides corti TaxID=53468 RepID=A0A0R3UGM9_MESCO|nr:unnamed protein product [Mesocestoides corti]
MSGGLSSSVSKSDLLRELSKFGTIADVWVARNPPGFAFVDFEKITDAEKAVRALDGITVCDSKLRVEFAHNCSRNGDRSRPVGEHRQYNDSRTGRSPVQRRYDSPPRRGRSPPVLFPPEQLRYPYEQLAAFYNPEMLNAAAAAAAAGFPYQIPGYPTMFPFLPPTEDVRRSMQSSRRHSPRRSPSYRRSAGSSQTFTTLGVKGIFLFIGQFNGDTDVQMDQYT